MPLRHLTLGLLAAAALLAAGPGASAADLDDYGYADQMPAPPPVVAETKVEFGTGWYVRGDLGVTTGIKVGAGDEPYSNAAINSSVYANRASYTQGVFNGPGIQPPGLKGQSSMAPIGVGTLGGGYQFNKWFRADLTADFRQPVKSIHSGATVPCITGTQGIPDANGNITSENIISTGCTPGLTASLQNFSILVNGYVDIPTGTIVTPYVGAGVGISFGHASASSTYTQNNTMGYAGTTYLDAVSSTSFYQNWDRAQSVQYYNLAFALMGGVAIDVLPHTKLDLGYRYMHLGQVLGINLNAHEARAGLRYMIDN